MDTIEDMLDLMGSQAAVAEACNVSRAHVCQTLRRARAKKCLQKDQAEETRLEDIL